MAFSNDANAQFVSPMALAEPYEDAIHLRKRTPSPAIPSTRPLSIAHSSAGLSTRELQALVKTQSALPLSTPNHRRASSYFEAVESPRMMMDDTSTHPYAFERPLDMARRFSSSVDLLHIPSAPLRPVHTHEKENMFGLDIRDPWGLSFRSETPYDAVVAETEVPSSPGGLTPGSFNYRRGSTPSLTSSPAASSATTSTASSLVHGAMPPTSSAIGPDMSGFNRRRVSSLSDMPLHTPPPPQPIPLGKSRMNNELQVRRLSSSQTSAPGSSVPAQYEADEATAKREKRKSFAWLRSPPLASDKASTKARSTSSPVKSAPSAKGQAVKASAPAAARAPPLPKSSLPLPQTLSRPSSISPTGSTRSSTPSLRSRSTLSLPGFFSSSKTPSPQPTLRQTASPPPVVTVAAPTPVITSPKSPSSSTMSTKPSFFSFGRRSRPTALKGPQNLPLPGSAPATSTLPPAGQPINRPLRNSSASLATVTPATMASTTPIASAFATGSLNGPRAPSPAGPPIASRAIPGPAQQQKPMAGSPSPISQHRSASSLERGRSSEIEQRRLNESRPTSRTSQLARGPSNGGRSDSLSPPTSASLHPSSSQTSHPPPRTSSRDAASIHSEGGGHTRGSLSLEYPTRQTSRDSMRTSSHGHGHHPVRTPSRDSVSMKSAISNMLPPPVVRATAQGIRIQGEDASAPPLPPK